MGNKQYTNHDWTLFKSKIPLWQEAYMERLNREYMDILCGEDKASEKFWALEKRIREDRRSVGVCVEMRRSMLLINLLSLLNEGVIVPDDLNDFSDEMKSTIERFLRQVE